jgi:hypothetical protein
VQLALRRHRQLSSDSPGQVLASGIESCPSRRTQA